VPDESAPPSPDDTAPPVAAKDALTTDTAKPSGVSAKSSKAATHARMRDADPTDRAHIASKPAAGAPDPSQAQAAAQVASATVQPPVSNDVVVATPSSATSDTTAPIANAATAVPPTAVTPAGDDNAAPTDIAATSMQSPGTVVTPSKSGGAQKPPSDAAKSQARQSTADALTDAGKAIGQSFVDRKVVSALPASADKPQDKKNDASPATPPSAVADTTPSHAAPAAPPAPPATAAAQPTTTPAQPAAVPAATTHSQAPVQAAPAIAIPNAPPANSAATQVSAQLQIGHPAQPDIAALAFSIASKSEGGAKHFDIRLDPVDLGRVDVRLTVDDAGKAQATLSVEKPQTLDMLQKDQPQLERALKDAGLDLSQNGLNFSLKGQQQQSSGGNNTPSSRGRMLAARAIAAVDSAASTVSLGHMSPGDMRLDIRV
jgi:flagellar hook-length control protein FliK